MRGALLVAALAGLWSTPASATPLEFELYELRTERLLRLSQLRREARLVLVDFFSESCKPCRAALPELGRLQLRYASRGLRVVLVAVPDELQRSQETHARLVALFNARRLPFAVVWDKYLLTARRFGVARKGSLVLPQAFLLDSAGQLLRRAPALKLLAPEIHRRLRP